jgi:hypothetical protein
MFSRILLVNLKTIINIDICLFFIMIIISIYFLFQHIYILLCSRIYLYIDKSIKSIKYDILSIQEM